MDVIGFAVLDILVLEPVELMEVIEFPVLDIFVLDPAVDWLVAGEELGAGAFEVPGDKLAVLVLMAADVAKVTVVLEDVADGAVVVPVTDVMVAFPPL